MQPRWNIYRSESTLRGMDGIGRWQRGNVKVTIAYS